MTPRDRYRVFIEHAADAALYMLLSLTTVFGMLVIFGSIIYACVTR